MKRMLLNKVLISVYISCIAVIYCNTPVEADTHYMDNTSIHTQSGIYHSFSSVRTEELNEAKEQEELEEEEYHPSWVDVGTFRITYYYLSEECCGKWAQYNRTASETIPQANHTIAANTDIFPIGTQLLINGITYTVEDTGNFGKQTLDVYADTYQDIMDMIHTYGDYADVYILE